jgi:small-conductance mechanosensitive channel/CRP-like cAMP-binding protein
MEPLLTATIILLAGLGSLAFLPRRRIVFRAFWTAVTFGLFTAALIRGIGSPFDPVFAALAGWRLAWAKTLEAFWWLSAARVAVAVLHVWAGADRKLGNSRLATDIIAGAIYLAATLAITNDVFQIPIRGLLATSGVIAIVLGLALQSTLSDVFSGISINIEEPFGVGDTIQLDGTLEGAVTQVNWRATHILTGMDDVAVIPNSVVAKARIINRSRPATQRGASLVISLDSRTSPETGMQVLRDAALTAQTPLRDPAPSVQCMALRANAVEYEITFHVRNDTDLAAARTELIRHIHRALAWSSIPVARNDGVFPELADPSDHAGATLRKLRQIGLFQALSAEEIAALTSKAKTRSLAPGEIAIAQGMTDDSLFLVASGVLEVTRDPGMGRSVLVGRLGPGDHFGETALLAGEAYQATATAITPVTLYILAKADLAPVMTARPALMEEFGHVVEQHRRLYADRVATVFNAPAAADTGALLQRIERFFRGASNRPG